MNDTRICYTGLFICYIVYIYPGASKQKYLEVIALLIEVKLLEMKELKLDPILC